MVAREKCSRRVVALLTVLAVTVVLVLLFMIHSVKASVSASTTDFKGGSAVEKVSEGFPSEISVFQADIVAPY